MLKRRALTASLWSAVEMIGASGINTIFVLVFARVITPAEFGIFAAAMLVAGFGAKLAIFGINRALVQRSTVDTVVLSTAFWLVMPAALALALALGGFAERIAALLGEPAAAAILPFVAAGMAMNTLGTLLTALLMRDLNMKALAKRTLLANVLSGLVATPFAFGGAGVTALLIQSVGGAALSLAFTLMMTGWPFRLRFDRAIARELLGFGAPTAGADILTHFNNESPKFFVLLLLGTEALGIFTMAMRVMNFLVTIIGSTMGRVIVPVLSEVRRTTGRVREAYLRLLRLVGAVILPAFVLVAVLHQHVIDVLLGPQWTEAGPVALFLCLAGLITTLNLLNGGAILAIGKPAMRLWFTFLRAAIGSVLLLALTPFGLVGAGIALLARGLIVEPLPLGYILRQLEAGWADYWRHVGGATAATTAMAAAGVLALVFQPGLPDLAAIGLVCAVCAVTYLPILALIDRDLTAEIKDLLARQPTRPAPGV